MEQPDSNAYTASMLDIHIVVTASGLPNFKGEQILLPSNFIFNEWEAIAHSQVDREVIITVSELQISCGF